MKLLFLAVIALLVTPQQSPDAVAGALTGTLPLMLIVAAVLALLASLFLLRRYRSAVMKSMRTSAGAASPEAPSSQTISSPVQASPDFIVIHRAAQVKHGTAAEHTYRAALRAPRRAAAIYAAAGVFFSFIVTTAFQLSGQLAFLPVRFVYLMVVFIWPLVPVISIVAAPTSRTKRVIVGSYFFVFCCTSLVAMARNDEFTLTQALIPWLVYNLPPTVLLFAFLNRKIRAVGPLVMVFTLIVIAGAFVTMAVLYDNDTLLKWVAEGYVASALSAEGLFIAILVSGMVLFAPLGWLVFGWIKNRYARKKISDQSLTLDAIWLLFGVTYSIYLAFAAPAWFLSGVLAFSVYKIAAATGFALIRHVPSAGHAVLRLLLLRVFALGKRSEQLFDALGTYWRYLGSIQMIAGPDLATTNLEPHEFMDFLDGKLARRFIWQEQIFEQRLAEADFSPDRDSRYRVNEFFCYRDTWKMVLSRLVEENRVVVMDLRGFSPPRAGCIFEITELINTIPLERVLFVVDQTTDETFLRQTASEVWQNMRANSPNRRVPAPPLRMYRLQNLHPRELQQLLRAICAAAHPA